MASKNFANVAAATAAGYKEIVTDRGASFTPASLRFLVVFDKWLTGETGAQSGSRVETTGEGASQVAAEAIALAALNNLRLHRYGADTGVSSGPHGGAHTTDLN